MAWAKQFISSSANKQHFMLTDPSDVATSDCSSYKLTNGNCNGMSSSCGLEHRGPVRTVSISRSGRYKSKSKQRARLLDSGNEDSSLQQSPVAADAEARPVCASTSPTSPTATAVPRLPETVDSTAVGGNGRHQRAAGVQSPATSGGHGHVTRMATSPEVTSSRAITSPTTGSNFDDEESAPRLEIAFESTDL